MAESLVKRLLTLACAWEANGGLGGPIGLLREAAEEIERLRRSARK